MEDNFTIAQLGESVLNQPAQVVVDFSCEKLASFIDCLLASMLDAGGVGIAAPQVFYSQQIMIIASRPNVRYPSAPQMDPLVMINPVIITTKGKVVYDWEGCLSVPGIRGWVGRHDEVQVRFQDQQGIEHQLELQGFVARIFLHEYDHLIGHTFVDRVESNRHLVAESVFLKILKDEIVFCP